MNSYDDLQRFKEKTHTSAIDFKDMSAEKQGNAMGDWPIINQLKPGEEGASPFAGAGRTSVISPDVVKPGTFSAEPITPSSAAAVATVTAAPVIPANASIKEKASSLLDEIAAMSRTQQPPVTAEPEPNAAERLHNEHAVSPLTAAVAASAPYNATPETPVAAPLPVKQPRTIQPPAEQTGASVNFAQLFAPVAATAVSRSAVKDMPLQPLLERIASCR